MTFWEQLKQWLNELFSSKPSVVAQPSVEEKNEDPGRAWFLTRLGWTEFSHDKELSKGWTLTKWCKSYTTVIGAKQAWCGMSRASALHSEGYSFPEQCETASFWINDGTLIDWKKSGIPRSATVVLQHPSGSYHVTGANRYHAPGEKFLDGLGGNQQNAINVTRYDLTKDRIVYVGMPTKARK